MKYSKYIQQIAFRKHLPFSCPLDVTLSAADEVENTVLPFEDAPMKQRLRALCNIPRMSTFAIGAMINRGVSLMPAGTCFLNIGVWHGFTFLAGITENDNKCCIGVDNFSQFDAPRSEFLSLFDKSKSDCHKFFEMDYAAYLAKEHRIPIGFYIYDAKHDYKNQLRGLRSAEPYFADGCILLVDDTNWPEPRNATLDFIKESHCEYELLLDRRTSSDRHPTFWNGVMVFRKAASGS